MTLRAGVLGAGIVFLLAALLSALAGGPILVPLAIAGVVLVLGVLFERYVYKPTEPARPGPEWQPTDERFVDPVSGGTLTVFVKPETGERRYVQTGEARRDPSGRG